MIPENKFNTKSTKYYCFPDLYKTINPVKKLRIAITRQAFIIPKKGMRRVATTSAPSADPRRSEPYVPAAVLLILAYLNLVAKEY